MSGKHKAKDSYLRSTQAGHHEDSAGDSPPDELDELGEQPYVVPAEKKPKRNRAAQRESRLRKEQRVRDLEAQLEEWVNGPKTKPFAALSAIITELMTENQKMRLVVRGLVDILGQNIEPVLPRIGMDKATLEAFVQREETDTARGFWMDIKPKKPSTNTQSSQPPPPPSAGLKRKTVEEPAVPAKRSRVSTAPIVPTTVEVSRPNSTVASSQASTSLTPPLPQSAPPFPAQNVSQTPDEGQTPSLFSQEHDYVRFPSYMASSSLFLHAPGESPRESTVHAYAPSPSAHHDFSLATGAPPLGPEMFLPDPPYHLQQVYREWDHSLAGNERKVAAGHLIMDHLARFNRDPSHRLPPSLIPTMTQRTIAHDPIIESILYPSLRDRMITHKAKWIPDHFDLAVCLVEYFAATSVHGEDLLDHNNWDVSREWLLKYQFLVDPVMLESCNRLKRQRGEPEVVFTNHGSANGTTYNGRA